MSEILTKLYKAAGYATKPSRDAATKIVENLALAAGSDGELVELAKLYKYFLPSGSAKPKDMYQWCGLARERSFYVKRPCYEDLQLIEGWLYGVSAHRMHFHPTGLSGEGFYNLRGSYMYGEDEAGGVLQLERLVNQTVKKESMVFKMDALDVEVHVGTADGKPVACYVVQFPSGIRYIQKKFLDDFVSHGEGDIAAFTDPSDMTKGVFFGRTDSDHAALIMPFKVKANA